MLNINRVISKIEEKGYKKGKFCTDILHIPREYLSEIARGKRSANNVPEEIVFQMAEVLETSFEYLMDMTDDPDPKFLLNLTLTTQEKLLAEVADRVNKMTEKQARIIKKLLDLPSDKQDKVFEAVEMMIE